MFVTFATLHLPDILAYLVSKIDNPNQREHQKPYKIVVKYHETLSLYSSPIIPLKRPISPFNMFTSATKLVTEDRLKVTLSLATVERGSFSNVESLSIA